MLLIREGGLSEHENVGVEKTGSLVFFLTNLSQLTTISKRVWTLPISSSGGFNI